jgi:hypothetical protein
VGASFTDYSLKFGDPASAGTTQVVNFSLTNVHGSRDYGAHIKLHSAQVTAKNVRLYTTNALSLSLINNQYSALRVIDGNLPIDPAGSYNYNYSNDNSQHRDVDSLNVTQSQGDTTHASGQARTSGLTFGAQQLWYDALHSILRIKQGTPTDQHDGRALTAISSQASTSSFVNIANNASVTISNTGFPYVAAGDEVHATFRPGGAAWVDGLVLQARCEVAGTVKVTLSNFTGSVFNAASTSFSYRLTYWSNLG